MKIISTNKNAKRNYLLFDEFEAGIVLSGPDVKTIRINGADINNSYISFNSNSLKLINMKLKKYKFDSNSDYFTKEQQNKTSWDLLLHKKEIQKLILEQKTKRILLIPYKLYFNRSSLIKVSFFTAKPIKKVDKREIEKEKQFKKEKQLY